MSHAYFFGGQTEEGIERSLAYIEKELKLPTTGNPDVMVARYGLLSVDDARALGDFARQAPVTGNVKAIVMSAGRFFHEAQNALLKLFEEPPEGTYLFLIVPSEGNILPTLRSRLQPLPGSYERGESEIATEFLEATKAGKQKIIDRVLDRMKSDKEEEKRLARIDARLLVEGLLREAYTKERTPDMTAFLEDLTRFVPILHESSAPLKPIFEHVMLTMPKDLVR